MAEGSRQHPLLLYVAAGAFLSFIVYTRLNLYLARRRIIKENGCKPCPYVYNKDPFLGLDVLFENIKRAKAHTFLEATLDRLNSFGTNKVNTFHTKLINYPVILTIEPENVKTILSLKFKDYSFGNRQKGFAPLLGHGIFNSDGERWANSRHLLRPNFAREQVADLSMLERHFRFLIKAVPKDGSTIDLQDLFFRMTIDTATEFLFNHSTESLRMVGHPEDDSNEDTQFAKAFQFAQADAMVSIRFGPLNGLRNHKQGDEAIRICHEYVDKWVDEAVRYREAQDVEKAAGAGKEERYVFIHELAKQTKDKKRIREELINILLAGRDTTASLLSNMFNMISRKPEIWQKLREEVEGLNGRTPSYEELRNFKYLKWCMNESLRLHPVVPGNSRLAIRDTVLPRGGGPDGTFPLFVSKGTLIAYSQYATHRRQDFFGADAEEYRPERWEHLRPGWEYLPFNGGPRICLGQQYALTEAGYVTVRMVQQFQKLECRDQGPWFESLTLTCASKNGALVGLTPAAA
ncbi:cytochrome P450 [Lophiostoma macrostomum CBS 122681]|uniref:Cytochrome P450 n=1 Tax=Lophiostoma macrostomum CBS 122681 TaxID=1314788 RepID=A0A6A6TL94_9PLEO|nr:cytochrome P450 [Lophiostoma macrostomum CBS 122681]